MNGPTDPSDPADPTDPVTAGTGSRPGPGTGKLLRRGLTKACPACGTRGQFRRWFSMAERCRHCGLAFERIEGHWVGALGLNTIVTFGILMLTLVFGLIVTFPDFPVAALIAVNVGVAVVVPALFFPFSRTLWTAVDIAMRPLEPHEVDWHAVAPEG